ncbi:MAG: RNA polymerase factor sigma-54, partial [Methylobacter sp.]|nr:RNA polymerase factor sigma-54 [Methylobacter sp.]
MKQSLNLRLGQQLSMTPQLQQAIKLLQMSTLELQQEIQQALESNMMLEVNEEESTVNEAEITPEKKVDNADLLTSQGSQTDMPDELPIDSSWDDVYEYAMESGSHSDETVEFESQRCKSSTLLDHLLWQVELTSFSDRDNAIAMAIIDSINPDGYLSSSPEDIFHGLQSQLDDLEFDEINAVLHRIQNLDPAGVAAIDLQDCLRLQLLQLPESTPYKEKALLLVTRYLDMLATHDQSKLMRKLDLTDRQLDEVVALIRTLDPKPGAQIQDSDSEYVIPDVYVSKQNNVWQVSLNPDIAPKLRINPFYSGMIKRADNSKDNVCMKDH